MVYVPIVLALLGLWLGLRLISDCLARLEFSSPSRGFKILSGLALGGLFARALIDLWGVLAGLARLALYPQDCRQRADFVSVLGVIDGCVYSGLTGLFWLLLFGLVFLLTDRVLRNWRFDKLWQRLLAGLTVTSLIDQLLALLISSVAGAPLG